QAQRGSILVRAGQAGAFWAGGVTAVGWLGLSRGGEAARDYLTRLRYCLARLRIGGTQHGISVIFDATANRRSYATGRAGRSRVFLKSSSTTHWELCIQRDPK